MNKAKLVFLLFISSLLGFLLGNFIIRKYESYAFRPWEWKSAPIIVNCYGNDLDEIYIIHAVHYWTLLGEEFAFIEQNPSDEICKNDYLHGFIMIKKKDLSYSVLGETVKIVKMGNITASVIYFDTGTYKISNVFEHELGHAIGYNHVELDGHIMHPIWDKMTDKFWIPE